MKVPQFVSELLAQLIDKLYSLLPEADRLVKKGFFIGKENISKDHDIQRVQSFYNLFLWIQRYAIPQLETYESREDLKEYLSWVLTFLGTQEWGRVILNSISQSLSSTGNSSVTDSNSSSQNFETQFLQQLHSIGSIIVNEIAPVAVGWASTPKIDVIKSVGDLLLRWGDTLKDQILLLITPQFNKVLVERQCSTVLVPGQQIPADQLSNNVGIQLVQLLYNAVCLMINGIFPRLKQLAATQSFTVDNVINCLGQEIKLFLVQMNPLFEQLNVLFLDEIWQSLPEKNRPAEKRMPIPETQMSADANIKSIQIFYNLTCLLLNHVVADLQKQEWKGITDVVNYAVKLIKLLLTHLNFLNEQLKVSFIDSVWDSLPAANRSSKKRELIPETKISLDGSIQMQQCFYNVACFLLNEIVPGIQACDSLLKLGLYLANQIQPLLKHLHPFINQLRRILIDEAYIELPPDARPKISGQMISEQGKKFSQDTNTRFIQITYDCACLLLNKILPEIEGCRTRFGVLQSIVTPGPSFRAMIDLVNDINFRFNYQKEEFFHREVNSKSNDEETIFSFIGEKLFPLLMGVIKVLEPVKAKILPLFSGLTNQLEAITQDLGGGVENFFAPIKPKLVKNNASLCEPSINLFTSLDALFKQSYSLASFRTMDGDLSYQAACIIYATSNELINQLIPFYQSEKNDKFKKEYQSLYKYLVMPITIIQAEIKEEKAFIPAFVREFIPKMQRFKEEINKLTTALNGLYGDGLKADHYEQYAAAIKDIETKKNAFYLEFEQLITNTKALTAVQDQQVITYDYKQQNVESTNTCKASVKPVLLKFSTWETEARKNVWEPFSALLEAKKKELQKLQANNLYLKNAYDKLVAENFTPIAEFLAAESLSIYSSTYHQKLFGFRQQLKKIKLDEALFNQLPHREFQQVYRQKIVSDNVLLDKTYQDLLNQLENKLTQQKSCFNTVLIVALTQKMATFDAELTDKMASINKLFASISLQNPEPTLLSEYEKQVGAIKTWVAEIHTAKVIETVLREKGLVDFGYVKDWLTDFYKVETYQQYDLKVKSLIKQLSDTIAEYEAKLKLATGQKVEKIESEIAVLNSQLLACNSYIQTSSETKSVNGDSIDPVIQLDDKKRKLIEQISPLTQELHLNTLSETCTASDVEKLSMEVGEKLAKLEAQQLTASTLPFPLSPIKNLHTQIEQLEKANNAQAFKFSSELVQEVKDCIDPLRQDYLEEFLNNLKQGKEIEQNRQETLKLLNQFLPTKSSEVAASTHSDEKKVSEQLRNVIRELKEVFTKQEMYTQRLAERTTIENQIILKQLQIKLANLQSGLAASKEAYSALSEKFNAIVKKLALETVGVLTWKEIAEKTIAREKCLSSELLEIKKLQPEIVTAKATYLTHSTTCSEIANQIAAVITKLPDDPTAKALPSVSKMLAEGLSTLTKKSDALDNQLKAKITEMENEIQIRVVELQTIANYSLVLQNADDLVKQLREVTVEIQTHEYNPQIIKMFNDATFLNPYDILEEDSFYVVTKKTMEGFEVKLKQLSDSAIKKDELSALENIFNQTLNIKIEEVKTARQQAQANYDRLKTAWESLIVQFPVIKNSRELSQAPKNVVQKVADCEHQDLRGIHLTDKNFHGVTLRDANLSGAHLQRCDFFLCNLQSVNFKGAKLEECSNINFQGVILDQNTELNWKTQGKDILLDNLGNPFFQPTQPNYFRDLIATVKSKTPIQGEWVLSILQKIGQHTSARPWTHAKKADLIIQQNHAVFIVKQLVPKMTSIDEVLKLSVLVETKHKEEPDKTKQEEPSTKYNPYRYIRRELDVLRFKYGNTQPWKEIIQTIQSRLNELAVEAKLKNIPLTGDSYGDQYKAYKAGENIMKTHIEHDYGFGFFYTPAISNQWKALEPSVTLAVTPSTC